MCRFGRGHGARAFYTYQPVGVSMNTTVGRRSLLRLFARVVSAAALPGSALAKGLPATSTEDEGKPFIVLPGSITRYRGQQGRENDVTELLATSAQTGGALGIFRQTIARGSGPPLHLHLQEDELAYVINGQFKFQLGDQVLNPSVGAFLSIPRKTRHAFKKIGIEPGVLLFGVAPGGFEMMFC